MITLLVGCDRGPEAPDPTAAWSIDDAPTLPAAGPPAREWRRMDLDQLDASMRAVTGGIGWVDPTDPTVDLWIDLHPTLGVPDYLTVTQEDRSTGVLFHKFLGDAAAQVCGELVARESVAGAAGNVFLVDAAVETDDPALIEANLSRAIARFHGRSLTPGDPELAPWVFLYDSTWLATGDRAEAWRTVCVGLFVHPDFYGY